MWLLDANLPIKLIRLLEKFKIKAETTEYRGWKELSNGQLVSAAIDAGFDCILTRDREFAKSAEKALKKFPQMGIVIVRLPQVQEQKYLEAFQKTWDQKALVPKAGQVIEWP